MSVQLLPFQKLVDIPEVAQRHRCAIRGLAITSIVLICTIVFLFLASLISSRVSELYTSFTLLVLMGIPSMVVLLFLVSISSAVALCNTDKWASADVCCNLMRSRPARCTRSCSGSKHCCARLSTTHISASILTSLICILFLAAIFTGCGESATIHSSGREYDTSTGSGSGPARCDDDIAANHLGTGNEKIRTCPRTGTCVVPLARGGTVTFTCTQSGWVKPARCDDDIAANYLGTGNEKIRTCPRTGTCVVPLAQGGTVTFTCTRSGWKCNGKCPRGDTDHDDTCGVSAGFEITTLILLMSLTATTAVSAYLLRQIEQSMSEVAVLPPGKMVTQTDELVPFAVVPHTTDTKSDGNSVGL
jgi:hypothetical protein